MRDLTSDTVIICGGGGYYDKEKVSRYDALGFVEDLPSLVEGRSHHGCGSYLREADGTQVDMVVRLFMVGGLFRFS